VILKLRFLIVLIAFSLTIQNTCPYGWAAKTVFLSPHSSYCPHCPLKEQSSPAKSDARNDVKKDISGVNHFFVLHAMKPETAFQILSLMDKVLISKAAQLKDVYLEPHLRPPVHIFSS
jgi:hypothetical protein